MTDVGFRALTLMALEMCKHVFIHLDPLSRHRFILPHLFMLFCCLFHLTCCLSPYLCTPMLAPLAPFQMRMILGHPLPARLEMAPPLLTMLCWTLQLVLAMLSLALCLRLVRVGLSPPLVFLCQRQQQQQRMFLALYYVLPQMKMVTSSLSSPPLAPEQSSTPCQGIRRTWVWLLS